MIRRKVVTCDICGTDITDDNNTFEFKYRYKYRKCGYNTCCHESRKCHMCFVCFELFKVFVKKERVENG